MGASVAQAVSRLPPTTGSRILVSVIVRGRSLVTFFSGYLPFSPATISIPPFLHTRIIHIEVVVDWGFTTHLTSQAICVAFYSEREKSDKFCSEAVISS